MGNKTEALQFGKAPAARVAGFFYVLTFVTGGLTVFRDRLVVATDAAATAANFRAHEAVVEWGFAADVAVIAFYVVVTALFYELFRPVNRSVSLVAALFSLMGCAIQAFVSLFHLAPLVVLGGGQYLRGFDAEQLQGLAFLFLKLHAPAYSIGLVFFGAYCVLIGCLVLRSTFLPRILGALMMLGGLSWMTFLLPSLARSVYPYNLAPGVLGEGALTLWLLVMGVNVQRWKERAALERGS